MFRVMLDTNILISAIIFPNNDINYFINHVIKDDKLFICDYVLNELELVIKRKFPDKTADFKRYIHELDFKFINTACEQIDNDLPSVRDAKDTPILQAAIKHNIDVFITGDKDFLCLRDDILKPFILTMSEYEIVKSSFVRLKS